jgi:hypothetical protein
MVGRHGLDDGIQVLHGALADLGGFDMPGQAAEPVAVGTMRAAAQNRQASRRGKGLAAKHLDAFGELLAGREAKHEALRFDAEHRVAGTARGAWRGWDV